MVPSNVLPMAWLACRWLWPLLAAFMLSTLIMAATVLVSPVGSTESTGRDNVPHPESVRADEFRPPLGSAIEPRGALMRVTCPDDPGVTADLVVDSVQALNTLSEGNCTMQPLSGLQAP